VRGKRDSPPSPPPSPASGRGNILIFIVRGRQSHEGELFCRSDRHPRHPGKRAGAEVEKGRNQNNFSSQSIFPFFLTLTLTLFRILGLHNLALGQLVFRCPQEQNHFP
jgi:hypothetical protein